MVVAARHHYN